MLSIRILFIILIIYPLSLLGQDFEVAPVIINFNANPGEMQIEKLTIKNHANEKQKYVFQIADYNPQEDGTRKQVELGSTENSCSEWLTVNPSFVELNPNEQISVDVMITVPSNGFKTRWSLINVQLAKENDIANIDKQLKTGVILVPRIAVQVKQSPKINNNYKARIIGFREISNENNTKKKFEVYIENIGDNIIEAKVSIAIANIKTAEEENFKPQKITVFPGYKRKIEIEIPKIIEPGKYAVAAIMDYGHRQPIEGSQLLLEIK